MAALDPPVAALLAAWLETTAALEDRAGEAGDTGAPAPLVALAIRFALRYLRRER